MASKYWTKTGDWRETYHAGLSEDERIIDIYTKAFVMSMGVRCPTKFRLIPRFKTFCYNKNDGLLPKTEEDIYDLIPDFIEHLGEI